MSGEKNNETRIT